MEILNYINGEWIKPSVNEYVDVVNPATGKVIAKTPSVSQAASFRPGSSGVSRSNVSG